MSVFFPDRSEDKLKRRKLRYASMLHSLQFFSASYSDEAVQVLTKLRALHAERE